MNMVESLVGMMQGPALQKISSMVGADEDATIKGITAAVPSILGALSNKAAQPGGAANLVQTLTQDFDGSMLSNPMGFLNNPVLSGGMNVLQHLFGDQQNVAENKIAQASGLSQASVGRLLPVIAPFVLNFIGKQIKERNLDAAGLTGFLSDQMGFLRSSAPGLLGFLERIDANDDGSIMDDLGRLVGRLFGRR